MWKTCNVLVSIYKRSKEGGNAPRGTGQLHLHNSFNTASTYSSLGRSEKSGNRSSPTTLSISARALRRTSGWRDRASSRCVIVDMNYKSMSEEKWREGVVGRTVSALPKYMELAVHLSV